MPACRTVSADGACSFPCAHCAFHFLLEKSQSSNTRQEDAQSDDTAAASVQKGIQRCEDLRQIIREMLATSGNLVFSRWKKKSKAKREAIIMQESPFVPRDARHNERILSGLATPSERAADLRSEGGIGINASTLPYLNAETLKSDPLRLLALLHHRSSSTLEDWVPYDLSQLELLCSSGVVTTKVFNLNCIAMRGKRFGELVPYKARECHNLDTAGLPLAAFVFDRQGEVLALLCRVLHQLVAPDELCAGNDKWRSFVATGVNLPIGGDRWSHFASPFRSPPAFDPARCLQDLTAHLAAAEDHLSCLQTDPEYLQSEVKSEMESFPPDAKAYANTCDSFWAHLAACILFRWTDQIRHLRWIAIQCSHVVELGKALPALSPGSTQRYDGALTALYKLAKVKGLQTKKDLYETLIRSSRFNSPEKTLRETVRRMMAGKSKKEINQLFRTDRLHWYLIMLCGSWPRYLSTDEGCLLASIDEHLENADRDERSRVDYKMYSILNRMAITQQMETSIALSHTHILPIGAPMDVCNNISTVDREHMPGIEMTLEVNTLQPTEAEKMELGAALRKVHEHPWPKGTRDVYWLAKAEQTRKFASDFWVISRKIYRRIISRPDIPKPELVDMMSWLDADSTPEHLLNVQAERAEILQRMAQQHDQATTANGDAPFQTQTTWGEKSDSKKFEPALDRTKPKTRPAAFGLQQDPDQDTAEIIEAMEEVSIRIPVNTESLRIFSRLFDIGHGPSKGTVKWQQIVTALCDAGLIGHHVGGSAVSFRSASGSEQGVIVFHKPHPELDVDLVALRHMGKRLHKWFGWTAETFVERKKSVADDKVSEKDGVTDTED